MTPGGLDRLGQDLRYAVRMLRRSPGFSLAAVLMLAIGIGVNVAVFGFINAAFLKPLPVRDPASLLRFERRAPDRNASELPCPGMAFVCDHTLFSANVVPPRTRQAPPPAQNGSRQRRPGKRA